MNRLWTGSVLCSDQLRSKHGSPLLVCFGNSLLKAHDMFICKEHNSENCTHICHKGNKKNVGADVKGKSIHETIARLFVVDDKEEKLFCINARHKLKTGGDDSCRLVLQHNSMLSFYEGKKKQEQRIFKILPVNYFHRATS